MIKIAEDKSTMNRIQVGQTKTGDTFKYGATLYIRTTDDRSKPDQLRVIMLPQGSLTHFSIHSEMVELVDLTVTVQIRSSCS